MLRPEVDAVPAHLEGICTATPAARAPLPSPRSRGHSDASSQATPRHRV